MAKKSAEELESLDNKEKNPWYRKAYHFLTSSMSTRIAGILIGIILLVVAIITGVGIGLAIAGLVLGIFSAGYGFYRDYKNHKTLHNTVSAGKKVAKIQVDGEGEEQTFTKVQVKGDLKKFLITRKEYEEIIKDRNNSEPFHNKLKSDLIDIIKEANSGDISKREVLLDLLKHYGPEFFESVILIPFGNVYAGVISAIRAGFQGFNFTRNKMNTMYELYGHSKAIESLAGMSTNKAPDVPLELQKQYEIAKINENIIKLHEEHKDWNRGELIDQAIKDYKKHPTKNNKNELFYLKKFLHQDISFDASQEYHKPKFVDIERERRQLATKNQVGGV